jgi:AcrR family transcriptional regulator
MALARRKSGKVVAKCSGAPKRASERIRESAGELFYRQGIRAVGVEEIVTHAGVTKPSLYRSFPSKDELAAAYLRQHGEDFLRRFDAEMSAMPDDPRGQFRVWLKKLSQKATQPDYRGCGVSNASVEYPDCDHPAHKEAAGNKRQFRKRLNAFARQLGVAKPGALADALLLLIEGACTSGQLFGRAGPARVVVEAADMLIDAYLACAD